MEPRTYTAFEGVRRIATGDLEATVRLTKTRIDAGAQDPILVFEDQTGRQIDFDFSGTPDEVVAKLARHPLFADAADVAASDAADKPRHGPGRPKLGVVSREVSLLPRHWEWLGEQPGGMSSALRRLVDEARKRSSGASRARAAREAASRFMWSMAGNLERFEDASRALFRGERDVLRDLVHTWPPDVRDHVLRLADVADAADVEAKQDGASVSSGSAS